MQGYSALHQKVIDVKGQYGSRSIITGMQGKTNPQLVAQPFTKV